MKTKAQKIALASMLAALCCVATMIIKIPSPLKGYLNLGDCIVLLSGWLLSPAYGFAAAGIGLADHRDVRARDKFEMLHQLLHGIGFQALRCTGNNLHSGCGVFDKNQFRHRNPPFGRCASAQTGMKACRRRPPFKKDFWGNAY